MIVRMTGSDWKGRRMAIAPAVASAPSVPCPSEAPVMRVMRAWSHSAFFANATSTALLSPERVNPLAPTTMPSWMNAAAWWAGITLFARVVCLILDVSFMAIAFEVDGFRPGP